MTDEDPISEALNLAPSDEPKPKAKEIQTNNTYPISSTFDERKRDYQMVRDNLKHIIETSGVAIDGILNVASEGESPRAYEVVSQLIKTTLEANESLVDLHKKIKDIEKEISRTQINKATMSHLCSLRARLAKLRTELLAPAKGAAGAGEGFDVEKQGDARVALIGFPSVGKSTILSTFTSTQSEAASYEFTTLT